MGRKSLENMTTNSRNAGRIYTPADSPSTWAVSEEDNNAVENHLCHLLQELFA